MFKNRGIKFQITTITLAINIFIIAVLITLSVFLFVGAGNNHIKTLEESLHESFDEQIKMLTQNTYSMFDFYYNKWQSGELTEAEAKAQAQELVRELRYDYGNNYFWVHQDDGYCIALYGSAKEGTNRFDELDAQGTFFIRNLISQGKLSDGGYNDVYFPRMGSQNPDVAEPKRTYSLYHEGIGWEVGTGNYVNDIDEFIAASVAAGSRATRQTLILMISVALGLLVISLFLSYLFSKRIADPIYKLTDVAKDLADGRLNVTEHASDKDKAGLFGVLEQAFEKLTEGISEQRDMVERLADGDLTVHIEPRSEDDTMGVSLKKMVDSLNGLFIDINDSAHQVSIGAKQVSDSAQTLAQGSTEQAAAIEQLSASISDIADKTNQNASIAKEAVDLSGEILDSAKMGSEKMNLMMQAVKDINEASNKISKVIKVIDDIAFQTNILALNAAVEAARAGQHGKGFAVVAEEVRNLAAKSAEAAEDTSGLIEQSIEIANLGLNIANETSESFEEIVDGINKSADIVAQISRYSEEQSSAIDQINTGIDQVAQVVQQNSATAQESAAASQEMSGQSDLLAATMAQFKLLEMQRQPLLTSGIQ
ncbi:MAG: methyl-accepting chemotaxis protein [Oscillospiraceae bacterium]|nr:methyl-accepting chemotaxis protein [Oscillospiraceae bacterium]